MLDIKVQYSDTKKLIPSSDELGFGNIFTDHMFMLNYTEGQGWHDARIVPYQPLMLDPSTMVFHYAQEIFEGLKAYKTSSGDIQLFRPEKNIERMNISNERMCIPTLNTEDVLQAIKAVVRIDEEWIPTAENTSLYIRPFIIATDPFLGVRPSNSYLFMIILSPVGAYYKEGINPVSIWVEEEYVRAVRGGVGYAKTGGNYAASLKAQMAAKAMGYTQVLWLDGMERKYIEEVGTMNVFFKINGEVITPSLEGSILPGVTRNSTIALLKDWGYTVVERKISIDELYEAYDAGQLEEVFGTGTAAVISPVGSLNYRGNCITVNNNKIGDLSQKLYDTTTGIQTGRLEDKYGWIVKVD
jgi:branched-chain amino acid aminotransferase